MDADVHVQSVQSVGLPGQRWLTDPTSLPRELPSLPTRISIVEYRTDQLAQAHLKSYNAAACDGKPHLEEGRVKGCNIGWAGPQQHLALHGRRSGDSRSCNLVYVASDECMPCGVLAMSVDARYRKCVVLAIHVFPSYRGPYRLGEHLWWQAHAHVKQAAKHAQSHMVRFALEPACCQSFQGAHFWIKRCGWDGTTDARRAAESTSAKNSLGQYDMWYVMKC